MPFHFRERIISGGKGDAYEAKYMLLKGKNREIGYKLAQVADERHGLRKNIDGSPTPLIISARRNYFERNYPIHLERMRGIADWYGMPLENNTVDFGSLYYQELDLGCSDIYYPSFTTVSGHSVLSRNMDFRAHLGPRPYLMEVYPHEGYPSLYMCNFDLLGCFDGVNSEGLVVALNADDETANDYPWEATDRASVGLDVLNVPRLLLDTCANVEEAKRTLLVNKQYYSQIPCHFIIGDRHGDSFVWEYSHTHNREHIIDSGGIPQILTNHLLFRRDPKDYPGEHETRMDTYSRYLKLLGALQGNLGKYTTAFIKETSALVFAEGASSNNRTLWHGIYDTHDRSLEIDFYVRDEPDSISEDGRIIRSGYHKFQLEV